MYLERRCGRPIYNAPPGIDKTPVCLMHSHDLNKDDGAFQAEFERILKEAGEEGADFTYFVFPSAKYSGRKFAAMCRFVEVTFTQAANFSGATFTKGADFRGARFTQHANFIGARFTQGADFRGATFTKGADFRRARFTQHANFIGARFTQDAHFSVATFTEDANFFRATFTQAADFIGATFTQHAHFGEATFTQAANFSEATFTQGADFSDAKFTQAANFGGATFTQDANFSTATFAQDADFSEATFKQDAVFEEATFAQVADFSEAKFMGPAGFLETTFRRDGGRDPGPIFTRTRFERPEAVVFADVDLGQALFYRGDVSKVGFSNVKWGRRENDKWMLFEEVANLEHASAGFGLRPENDTPDDRNYVVIAELYQQLKKNYDDRRDYWTAGDFHYGEMEMKRLACPHLTWLPWLEAKLAGRPGLGKLGAWCGKLQSNPRLLSKLRSWHQRFGLAAWYRRASDYGESWGKPLLWLFAVLVLFAALYPLLGLRPAAGKSPTAKTTSAQVETPSPQETDLRYWNYERPGRLFCHSVMTSLDVAAFQRDLAYEPSYPWGRLLALFELLLTSTLIA
jgi:uncharacterized protein YjbI with pentapeptide repeats